MVIIVPDGRSNITNHNVEVKARVDSHEPIRNILMGMGAKFLGSDHQIDTYYRTIHGRLKVRKGNIENCIVWYQRPDTAEPKRCDYRILSFSADGGETTELTALLGKALDLLVIVEKVREIYVIENIKIHLDVVEKLGNFLEIEVISAPGITLDDLNDQCNKLLTRFEIPSSNFVVSSYSDMVLKNII